jgi:hypothetical protein
MLKQVGAVKLKGLDKSNNKVHVQGKKDIHSRERPKKGSHRNEPAFKAGMDAAGAVARTAGDVNTVFKFYGTGFLQRGIYSKLLKAVWKADHPHRFVKLAGLENFNGHYRYPMHEIMNGLEVIAVPVKRRMKVSLNVTQHARLEREHRFYRLQAIVVFWNSENDKYVHTEQRTRWMHLSEEPDGYDMQFDIPVKSTDYLVMCCCIRGEEKGELRLPPDRTLKIMLVGSLAQKSLEVLAEHRAALKAREQPTSKDRGVEEEGLPSRREVKKREEDEGVAGRKAVKERAKKAVLPAAKKTVTSIKSPPERIIRSDTKKKR